jgi:hypothetical protein
LTTQTANRATKSKTIVKEKKTHVAMTTTTTTVKKSSTAKEATTTSDRIPASSTGVFTVDATKKVPTKAASAAPAGNTEPKHREIGIRHRSHGNDSITMKKAMHDDSEDSSSLNESGIISSGGGEGKSSSAKEIGCPPWSFFSTKTKTKKTTPGALEGSSSATNSEDWSLPHPAGAESVVQMRRNNVALTRLLVVFSLFLVFLLVCVGWAVVQIFTMRHDVHELWHFVHENVRPRP